MFSISLGHKRLVLVSACLHATDTNSKLLVLGWSRGIYVYIYIFKFVYIYTYVYIYIYIITCIYVYIYIYVSTFVGIYQDGVLIEPESYCQYDASAMQIHCSWLSLIRLCSLRRFCHRPFHNSKTCLATVLMIWNHLKVTSLVLRTVAKRCLAGGFFPAPLSG